MSKYDDQLTEIVALNCNDRFQLCAGCGKNYRQTRLKYATGDRLAELPEFYCKKCRELLGLHDVVGTPHFDSSTWSGAQCAKEIKKPHMPKPIKAQGSHLKYKGEEIHDQSGIYEGLAHVYVYEVI